MFSKIHSYERDYEKHFFKHLKKHGHWHKIVAEHGGLTQKMPD